jgi:hypothetical protein
MGQTLRRPGAHLRHRRPCAGDPDGLERRAFHIGMAGTRLAMTARDAHYEPAPEERIAAEALCLRMML